MSNIMPSEVSADPLASFVFSTVIPPWFPKERVSLFNLVMMILYHLEIKEDTSLSVPFSLTMLSLAKTIFHTSDFAFDFLEQGKKNSFLQKLKEKEKKVLNKNLFFQNISLITAVSVINPMNKLSPMENLAQILKNRLRFCCSNTHGENIQINLLICFTGFMVLKRVSLDSDNDKRIFEGLIEYSCNVLKKSASPLALKVCQEAGKEVIAKEIVAY